MLSALPARGCSGWSVATASSSGLDSSITAATPTMATMSPATPASTPMAMRRRWPPPTLPTDMGPGGACGRGGVGIVGLGGGASRRGGGGTASRRCRDQLAPSNQRSYRESRSGYHPGVDTADPPCVHPMCFPKASHHGRIKPEKGCRQSDPGRVGQTVSMSSDLNGRGRATLGRCDSCERQSSSAPAWRWLRSWPERS